MREKGERERKKKEREREREKEREKWFTHVAISKHMDHLETRAWDGIIVSLHAAKYPWNVTQRRYLHKHISLVITTFVVSSK